MPRVRPLISSCRVSLSTQPEAPLGRPPWRWGPRAVTVSADAKNAIAIAGVLSAFSADKRLPDRPVTYTLKFRFSGGKVFLSELNQAEAAVSAADLAGSAPASGDGASAQR